MAQRETDQTNSRLENALDAAPFETEALLAIVLNHAAEAEANFLGLYDVAIRKVGDEEDRRTLVGFRGDHEERLRLLRGLLDQMGAPLYARDEPTPVALGLVERLEAAETDDALLMDFLASEDFSRRFYEWVATVEAPEPISRLAQRALDDEGRHYRWAARRCGLEE